MKKHINGISLLECLLSIAIIASISMMAVRYYIVTTRDTRVSHAISQVKRITNASYEWLSIQRQSDFSNADGGQTITIAQLVQDDLLKDENDTISPWGGQIEVAPGDDDAKYVKITLTEIPQPACRNLTQQLEYINKDKTNPCGNKKSNTFVGEF
jgi:type II secretory pathway pseudopilin PulG